MKRILVYFVLALIVLGFIGFLGLGLFPPEASRQTIETVIPNDSLAPR